MLLPLGRSIFRWNIFTIVWIKWITFLIFFSASPYKKEPNGLSKEEIKHKYFLPEVPGLNENVIWQNQHTQNKPGLYVPVTKANIVRNNELFRLEYIFEPNDDSIFYAKKASINNETGEKIYRNILYTNTKEEALEIINKYKEQDDYIRNYAYQYGNNILDIRWIPSLLENERKTYELF